MLQVAEKERALEAAQREVQDLRDQADSLVRFTFRTTSAICACCCRKVTTHKPYAVHWLMRTALCVRTCILPVVLLRSISVLVV
jgi:hypothetical protein